MSPQKKLIIGWFTFSCCEDSTVLFTELLNDHWQEWLPLIEFRHAKVLKSKNQLKDLDVAFVEGAIASAEKEKELKKIRDNSKILVAVGSCAVTGMPSALRNEFPTEIRKEINFLLEKFNYGEKVKKLEDIVKVDAKVPGCPMNETKFLEVMNDMLKKFNIVKS
jgi:coenzyme F420-reducing hydrogenase gamma subunit